MSKIYTSINRKAAIILTLIAFITSVFASVQKLYSQNKKITAIKKELCETKGEVLENKDFRIRGEVMFVEINRRLLSIDSKIDLKDELRALKYTSQDEDVKLILQKIEKTMKKLEEKDNGVKDGN